MSVSPRQSPYINSLIDTNVKWINTGMRTNAGELLISKRYFAVTKCSPWLVSKHSPRLLGCNLSYTESCYKHCLSGCFPSHLCVWCVNNGYQQYWIVWRMFDETHKVMKPLTDYTGWLLPLGLQPEIKYSCAPFIIRGILFRKVQSQWLNV
jgi:hypothetical protein